MSTSKLQLSAEQPSAEKKTKLEPTSVEPFLDHSKYLPQLKT